MPQLTFGMPVYNAAPYLHESLNSLIYQDLEDIEIVISDNGSTDNTKDICYTAAQADERIRYLRSDTNRGGAWNYGRVFDASTARLFSWMAADDIKLPGFASSCVSALDQCPEAVFACPRTQIIDPSGVVIENLNDQQMGLDAPEPYCRVRNLLRSQASHVLYGVIRADALRQTRGLRPMVGDDMTLLTELLCIGPMVLVDGQYFHQRRHPEQLSRQGKEQIKWHAPDAEVRFAFPQSRLNVEYFRAIGASALSVEDKCKCWAQVVTSWTVPHWRAVASDIATALGVRWRPGRGGRNAKPE